MTDKHNLIVLLISLFSFLNISTSARSGDLDSWLGLYIATGTYEYLQMIVDKAPDSREARFCEANEYIGINNEKAVALANALVTDHPDFARAYYLRGRARMEDSKKPADAVTDFNRAIELDPYFSLAYLNRGIARMSSGDPASAKLDFEKLLEMDRRYPAAILLQAVVNDMLGDGGGLTGDLEIALMMDLTVLSDYFYPEVRLACNKAIETAPENVNLFHARGYANFNNGYYRQAAADFQSALGLIPGNAEYYKYSGACKTYLKDADGALKDLNLAIGINPDDPEIYYYLGILMNQKMNRPEMAFEYLTNAIELENQDARYYYERARSSYDLSDFKTAKDDINTALSLDKRNGDYYALRGLTKIELGSPSGTFCTDLRKATDRGTSYNLKKYIKKNCR